MATAYATKPRERFRCLSCGARDAQGGCQDPKKCVAILERMEREGTRKIVNALDRRCGKEAIGFALIMEALDLLSIGLVVCNFAGQLLSANQFAEEILRTRDGLELDSDGALCAIRACGQSSALAKKVGPRRELGTSDAAFAIQRSSGKRALTVMVRSMKDAPTTKDWARPAALVLILDSTLSVKTTEAELHQLYGLTTTEARLANLLTEGKALQDCCRDLGISRSTACTHLRRLFKKTRVRRQSELVSLLLRSVGLARLGNSAAASLSMLGLAANTGHVVNHLLAGVRETNIMKVDGVALSTAKSQRLGLHCGEASGSADVTKGRLQQL